MWDDLILCLQMSVDSVVSLKAALSIVLLKILVIFLIYSLLLVRTHIFWCTLFVKCVLGGHTCFLIQLVYVFSHTDWKVIGNGIMKCVIWFCCSLSLSLSLCVRVRVCVCVCVFFLYLYWCTACSITSNTTCSCCTSNAWVTQYV